VRPVSSQRNSLLGVRRTAFGVAVLLSMSGAVACSRSCGETPHQGEHVPLDAHASLSPPTPALVKDPEIVSTDGGEDSPLSKRAKLANLTLRRGIRVDCIELRPARPGDNPRDPKFRVPNHGSESLGVPALTFFHGAFAKAHPGFDLTTPRLLAPTELTVLAHELTELSMALLAASDLASAKTRWAKVSPLVAEMAQDDEWAQTRPVLAETARGLAAKAKAHAEQKEGLWVVAF
jgi:hypothetical protein